jgi:hypothetical protein
LIHDKPQEKRPYREITKYHPKTETSFPAIATILSISSQRDERRAES